ncbi:MAG: tyrosine--tRNA ligase 2 [Candidatus Hepatoplasma vulgare]|nr:MAG: tyrosine--tRNA ligase 2 [Candidatus Hepatoplasma sp.]
MDFSEKIERELSWRGLYKESANFNSLNEIIKLKSKFYVGVDPTASSLHIGHYVFIVVSKLIYDITKMTPVFVIGGLTGQIGDPSGKQSERNLISEEIIKSNVKQISKQLSLLAKNIGIENFEIFNNMDVYKNMSIVKLFQKFGKLFNLKEMIAKDMVKNRLDNGLSYTEFSYQVFQAIDFLTLFEKKNVRFQIGGSDQWGNITSGIELIRKIKGVRSSVSGLTINLLLDENNNKIGKTGGNAIWLDKNRFSSFDFYQYLLNISDFLAENLLCKLTLIKKEDFNKIISESKKYPKKKLVQEKLAKKLLSMIHGENIFEEVKNVSKILFEEDYKNISFDDFLKIEKYIGISFKYENIGIMDFLLKHKMVFSRREFREFINLNAIRINGDIINDENRKIESTDFLHKKYIVINVGKKRKYLIKK